MPPCVIADRSVHVVGGVEPAVPPDGVHGALVHVDVREDLVPDAARVVAGVYQLRGGVLPSGPVQTREVDPCLAYTVTRHRRVRTVRASYRVGDAGVVDEVDLLASAR